MANPPDPGLPAILLATASRMGYRITTKDPSGGELGVLVEGNEGNAGDAGSAERPLYAVSAGSIGTVQWSFEGGKNLVPHLFSRETADVLCGGTANRDGTVSFAGRTYAVRQSWNGAQMVAEAYQV